MQNPNQQQSQQQQNNSSTNDIGEEFGTKLSINPNLPANTDFSGGQLMDTPNSFKCGATPTTPFGLSHLQFPASMLANFGQIANYMATPNGEGLATAEELLNFMPKTPLLPNNGTGLNLSRINYGFQGLTAASFQQLAVNQQNEQNSRPSGLQTQAEVLKLKTEVEKDSSSVSSSNVSTTRKKQTRKSHLKRNRDINGRDESRWKSWTREEEVFLVGAVMDRFFKRGSLSSTKADESNSDDSWSVIKNYYETAWKNYYIRTGVRIPTDRPANALSRHYKVMKARISQTDISGGGGEDFRTYFDEWEKIYNVDNCLVAELLKRKDRMEIEKGDQVKNFAKRKVRLSVTGGSSSNNPSINFLQ